MTFVPRFFEPPAASYFLFGPRGTGKTSWLNAKYPNALRLDLLDAAASRQYTARPESLIAFVEGNPHKTTIIVDEVQKAPQVLESVHLLIEKHRHLRFVLTGSSARKLRRGSADLLAGRAVQSSMHPYMAAELGHRFDLEKALLVGLVPLVWEAPDSAAVIRSYASLYLREEVQMEGIVRNISGFARFLEAISFSHASVLNVSNIARESSVSRTTVNGFVDILEDLLLGFKLPVFKRRAKRELSEHPKFYYFDVGVFRSLRPKGPLDPAEPLENAALEGLVAQHLKAWIAYSRQEASLYFWRTRSNVEVDFILYAEDALYAFEVKNTLRIRPEHLRGLKAFTQDYPIAKAALLYRGPDRLLIDGIPCLPCSSFLSAMAPNQPLLPMRPD